MSLRWKDKRDIQAVKEQYFESTLGHFGVFVVELHPLLDDTADSRVRVVDELEAGDVSATFPQVRQVNVQETLKQAGNRHWCELRYQEEKWAVFVQDANCQTVKNIISLTVTSLPDSSGACQQTTFISAPNYVCHIWCHSSWLTCFSEIGEVQIYTVQQMKVNSKFIWL